LFKTLKWLLVGLFLLIALFFLLSGRVGLALASLPALLPWFIRFRQAARVAKAFRRMAQQTTGGASSAGQSGQTSDVTTRYLHMVLDHDSGAMHGKVLRGTFKGRDLGSLTMTELLSLLQECRSDDGQSTQVLETYLNREHPNWQDHDDNQDNAQSSGNNANMSAKEALQVLGLDETASQDDIREAHRHLIASVHPDKGGSTYLAAKINQAKDILINS